MSERSQKAKMIIIMQLVWIFLLYPVSVAAERATPQISDNTIQIERSDNSEKADISEYSEYLSRYGNVHSATEETVLMNNTEKKFSAGHDLNLEIEVETDSLYEISLTYMSLGKADCGFTVTIDGDVPFFESKNLKLPTYWCDNGESRSDSYGNEFAPEQTTATVYTEEKFRDYSGEFENPYLFFLSGGKHSLNLKLIEGECTVKSISLTVPENALSYSEAADLDAVNNSNEINNFIVIEGEEAYLKSSSSLISMSDDSSADISPSSAEMAVLNYIGGSNWSGQNDTIVWKFNIEKAGYYNIGFVYRQKDVVGGVSYRHLKIDGKTPFQEAKRAKFTYSTYWKFTNYSNGEEPYWFYLDKGEHSLSLSVTAGELTDIYRQLKEVSSGMGDLYIDITMVVGETVDVSRSYELFNQIPEFNERLKSSIDRLESIANQLEKLQEKESGTNVSTIRNAIETLEKMYDNPYSAHKYKSSYYTAYTNLSAMLGTICDMPLDIDRIFIIGKDAEFNDPTAGFFEKLSFGVKRFIYSFADDYENSETENGDSLTLWVNWGRDQTQVLDALAQSEFSAKTGIPVKVRLVNATLIQAILSGNGPDVMLQMSRTEPVNLAMRGALLDLTRFDDFNEVTERFTDDATVPYTYIDGVYAIPDTMTFYLMFVRTDILTELNLEIPETWQDFIYAMTVLQHKNLQVSLPYTQITDSSTVNVGVGGLTLYPTILLQNGLNLYNADLTASTLTEEAQINVFSNWISLYTKYKVPKTMDFYNRFRLGSAPIGIAPYTLYTQLKAAAPEIEGRWTVAMIPGTEQEDGMVNKAVAGSGTGCAITKLSKNPENSWEFLKWWTSAKTQIKYSDNLESVLGYLGRAATSNIETLNSMLWDEDMRNVLNQQLNSVVQIPEIPGGYYTARGIDQAFWNVVEQNENPTDMMLEWGEVVDAEIARKQQEYAD